MKQKNSILVVDDEKAIRHLLQKELTTENRKVFCAQNGREALRITQENRFDVIVLDLRLPDVNGLELLVKMRELIPDVEIVMITGHGDVDSAVEAIKYGAYDFIEKPFNLKRLELVIDKARQRATLARENRILRCDNNTVDKHEFIGNSKVIQDIRFLVNKVAPTMAPVLITGPSGAGKDVVANKIHALSTRSTNPLIAKNCAALEKELARSELFGHVRGAFTGATESREGLISFADNGTLFLDEVGELPAKIQASLLRVLENGSYRRVGEKKERKVNIRLLLATNRNLAEEVHAGRFNEAFYHRVNVFNIDLPPLAQRKEDLPLLVDFFLAKLSPGRMPYRITDETMACLFDYSWPGNVRELRNVIERSIILAENDLITKRCLPRELASMADDTGDCTTLYGVEKKHILHILARCNGNRKKAAELLGISRKTLYRRLREYHKL